MANNFHIFSWVENVLSFNLPELKFVSLDSFVKLLCLIFMQKTLHLQHALYNFGGKSVIKI